jgi:hypothetical protein
VPTTGGAYLAFNNTSVALRDATGALHLVWDDTQQGYHGRHDGSTWQVQPLPKVGTGRVSKVSLAALTDGELVAAWSEDDRGQRSVVVARTEDLRSRWTTPLVLATGTFDAPVALHVYRRSDASDGVAVAWMDTANNRLQVRAWAGMGWASTDWSPAVSPAAATAQPHDVALAGRGARVWALWEDQRAGGPTEIYLSHSDDGGVTWHPDQRLPLASGSAGGGDPSAVVLADGTLLVAWQSQGRVQYARSTTTEATAFGAPVVLGQGLFPHIAMHPRGQVAFTWEHFTGGAFDDTGKSVGNSLSLDDLATLDGPHAMPGSAEVKAAVQAAVCATHDRIDVFWIDVSTTGQRVLKWRSGRMVD